MKKKRFKRLIQVLLLAVFVVIVAEIVIPQPILLGSMRSTSSDSGDALLAHIAGENDPGLEAYPNEGGVSPEDMPLPEINARSYLVVMI